MGASNVMDLFLSSDVTDLKVDFTSFFDFFLRFYWSFGFAAIILSNFNCRDLFAAFNWIWLSLFDGFWFPVPIVDFNKYLLENNLVFVVVDFFLEQVVIG